VNALAQVAHYEIATPSLLARVPAFPRHEKQGGAASLNWENFRNHQERRLVAMRDWRISWWQHWAEIAAKTMPRRYHWLVTPNTMVRGLPINAQVIDSTVPEAIRVCVAGLFSGLMSSSRPWFQLGVKGMNDSSLPQEWGLYLDEFAERVYAVLEGSNCYDAAKQMFQDLVLFSTGPMLTYEHPTEVINCQNPCAGEYYLAVGGDLGVQTFARLFAYTVMQIVDRFGIDNVPDEIRVAWEAKAGTIEKEYVIAHMIEPNYPAGSFGTMPNLGVIPGDFAYREHYWIFGRSTQTPLASRGFHEQPGIYPRWATTSNDAYGRDSPGMECLPDIKQLYRMQERLAEAIDKKVRPPLQAHVSLKNSPSSILPGAVTYVADPEKGGMRKIYDVDPEVAEMMALIEKIQGRIKVGCYNDVFMAITQMEGVQPRNQMEIDERKQERMQVLGTVVEKFHREAASPFLKRVIAIMARRGLLPPRPKSMHGVPIEIQYISPLALAQRAAKTAGMERWLNVIGGIAKAGKPEIWDNVDEDEFAQEYASDMTVPRRIRRDKKQRDALRKQRAQAQAQQQMAAHAAAAAPALNQASSAAKNFADLAQGGGIDAIRQMMGPSGVPQAGIG
jgi:hypothetical protein